VNDIEVEFGNSLYQPMLDRYIAGESCTLHGSPEDLAENGPARFRSIGVR
jgi:hypothetical protein